MPTLPFIQNKLVDWILDFYNYRIVQDYIPMFIQGIWTTTWISFASLIGSIILGTGLALMRMSSHAILWRPVSAYNQLIRATPLLIQLYLFYYGLPLLSGFAREINEVQTGLIALIFHTAPYMGEIIRAGIESVNRGQVEASLSVGMNFPQRMIHVVLPQAFANITPPMLGQAAVLVKDTSLLSLIAVTEVLTVSVRLMSERIAPNESFITVAICYMMIYLILLVFSNQVQRKLGGAAWLRN